MTAARMTGITHTMPVDMVRTRKKLTIFSLRCTKKPSETNPFGETYSKYTVHTAYGRQIEVSPGRGMQQRALESKEDRTYARKPGMDCLPLLNVSEGCSLQVMPAMMRYHCWGFTVGKGCHEWQVITHDSTVRSFPFTTHGYQIQMRTNRNPELRRSNSRSSHIRMELEGAG